LVHAQLARTEQAEFLAALLRMGLQVRRTGGGATGARVIVALDDAEEDVTLVIAHRASIIVGVRRGAGRVARRGRRLPRKPRRGRLRRSAPRDWPIRAGRRRPSWCAGSRSPGSGCGATWR